MDGVSRAMHWTLDWRWVEYAVSRRKNRGDAMAAEAASSLKLRVEGMDCGACGLKIENGLQRLPGIPDLHVNVGLETLSLVLDEDRISRRAIEASIRSTRFQPTPLPGEIPAGAHQTEK